MTLTKKGEKFAPAPERRPAPASWGLASRPGAPWEYAPAPEATDHIKIRPEYGLFIDNEFSPARPKKTFQVLNPATEEPLAKVAHASKADVNRAVGAARRAYDRTWSRLPGSERAKGLPRSIISRLRSTWKASRARHASSVRCSAMWRSPTP